MGSIPGLGKSPGGGNGNPFQYSCMENSMDRGAWRATIHRVAKSWTWLSNFTFTFIQLKYVNWNFDRNLKAHLPSLSHHVRNSRTRAFPIQNMYSSIKKGATDDKVAIACSCSSSYCAADHSSILCFSGFLTQVNKAKIILPSINSYEKGKSTMLET